MTKCDKKMSDKMLNKDFLRRIDGEMLNYYSPSEPNWKNYLTVNYSPKENFEVTQVMKKGMQVIDNLRKPTIKLAGQRNFKPSTQT